MREAFVALCRAILRVDHIASVLKASPERRTLAMLPCTGRLGGASSTKHLTPRDPVSTADCRLLHAGARDHGAPPNVFNHRTAVQAVHFLVLVDVELLATWRDGTGKLVHRKAVPNRRALVLAHVSLAAPLAPVAAHLKPARRRRALAQGLSLRCDGAHLLKRRRECVEECCDQARDGTQARTGQ